MDLLALRELLTDLLDKTGLPYVALSESVYKFNDFQPQQKHIPGTNELEPLRDAVIRDIQTAMHMQGLDPEFLERGPGLVAIVGVLEGDSLLEKEEESINRRGDESATDSTSAEPGAKRQKSSRGTIVKPSRSKSVHQLATQGGKQAVKARADFALLLFLCCNCLPPRVVDSIQFKNLVKVLHPWYKAPHSSTIADNLVPTEANRVRVLQIAYLKTCRDLTISFDGGNRDLYTP
jgi:hypothetical protein